MAKFIKPIKEIGIITSKIYKEARQSFKDSTGKEWPASEEKFLIEVISCDEDDFNPNTGILNGTRAEYPVDKATFEKAMFGMWAKVKIECSQFGDKMITKPLSFEFIEKKLV